MQMFTHSTSTPTWASMALATATRTASARGLERIAEEDREVHGQAKLVVDHLGLDVLAHGHGLGGEHGDEVGGEVLHAHGRDALDLLDGAGNDGGQHLGRDTDAGDGDLLRHAHSFTW